MPLLVQVNKTYHSGWRSDFLVQYTGEGYTSKDPHCPALGPGVSVSVCTLEFLEWVGGGEDSAIGQFLLAEGVVDVSLPCSMVNALRH